MRGCRFELYAGGWCGAHTGANDFCEAHAWAAEMGEVMENGTNGASAPVQFEEGKRADRSIYFLRGRFQVRKTNKYIGQRETLEEAIQLRDEYEAANPPKPLGPQPKPTPPAVGAVVTLASGGDGMTVIRVAGDRVGLMAWSNGELVRLWLPVACIEEAE